MVLRKKNWKNWFFTDNTGKNRIYDVHHYANSIQTRVSLKKKPLISIYVMYSYKNKLQFSVDFTCQHLFKMFDFLYCDIFHQTLANTMKLQKLLKYSQQNIILCEKRENKHIRKKKLCTLTGWSNWITRNENTRRFCWCTEYTAEGS